MTRPGICAREYEMVRELTALLPAVSADPGELQIFLSHKKLAIHPAYKSSCTLHSLQCSVCTINSMVSSEIWH